MTIKIKFCGLKRALEVEAAAEVGAAYVGFVHFAKSPRHLDVGAMRDLALHVPPGLAKVVLVVNPDDALLDRLTDTVPLDMIQLHGAETPERVSEIRARYGLPVMKAIGISEAADIAKIGQYSGVADQLLVDAKPPKGAAMTGGNGITFDWQLIAGRKWFSPWMLAGGLTAENVAEAVRLTQATQVDLSSSVESAPGVKDPAKMAAFAEALTGL